MDEFFLTHVDTDHDYAQLFIRCMIDERSSLQCKSNITEVFKPNVCSGALKNLNDDFAVRVAVKPPVHLLHRLQNVKLLVCCLTRSTV